MDGHFVPNITFGPVVVRWLKPVTPVPLEVHLMIAEPDRYLEAFAEAGADTLIVHQEGAIHLNRTVQEIHRLGIRAGVALNPASPAVLLEEILPDLELVLVMTVNPGFGGQQFLSGMLPKIRRVRQMIDQVRPDCELEVDGGIEPHTAPLVVEAGAQGHRGRLGGLWRRRRRNGGHRPAQRCTRPTSRTDRLASGNRLRRGTLSFLLSFLGFKSLVPRRPSFWVRSSFRFNSASSSIWTVKF